MSKDNFDGNWLVYHYNETDCIAGSAKGYRVVNIEFMWSERG